MAFKTDQLKLRETYANDGAAGTPADGTLALIGATGSKILKVRDDGSWAAVVSSGGATNLAGLSDVPAGPAGSDQNKVCTIDGSSQMVYNKITIDNIHADTIQVASESFADNDTTLMTSAAIQDHIQELAASTFTAVLTTMSSDYAVPTNNVTKIVITANPGSNKFTLKHAAAANGWTNHSVIEIINMSNHVQTLTRDSGSGSSPWFLTNTAANSTSGDIQIGLGQRILIMPNDVSGTPNHNITILSA